MITSMVMNLAKVLVLLTLSTSLVLAAAPSPRPHPTSGVMRSCEARVNAINMRSSKMVDQAETMLAKFGSIAARAQEFYTSKVVSKGITVASYDALVSDVQTQKSVAEAILNAASSDLANFSCQSGNPKAQLELFRQDMLSTRAALKTYRQSVINLVKGIHAATPDSL